MEAFIVAVALFVSFVLGLWIGASAIQSGFVKDCEAFGFHRIGDKVYECKERK